MKRLGIAILTIAVLLGGAAFYYSFPNHRFRLTIEIDTPDGVKLGSSVIAVYASDVKWGLPETTGFRSRIKGEAVFVDLGSGRNLIALLAHGKGAERSERVNFLAQEAFARAGQKVEWFETKTLKGVAFLTDSLIPTMVAITNPADPATTKVVYATEDYDIRSADGQYVVRSEGRVAIDVIESTFGSGYRFKRAWVEVTRDAVTTGIKQKLPWIGDYARETVFKHSLRESGGGGVLMPGRNLKRG